MSIIQARSTVFMTVRPFPMFIARLDAVHRVRSNIVYGGVVVNDTLNDCAD